MKISLRWLQKFVDVDILGLTPEDLSQALTMVGLAVETIEKKDDEFVFDLDVTTNRPDCLNHLGVARELAAHYRLRLRKPDFSAPRLDETRQSEFPIGIEIEDPYLCPRYAARVISGVRVAASPPWLKRSLESVGQRPINNVVDITNYALFELGHPLHAFDYDKVEGHKIIVRRARSGESLQTLDGIDRDLAPSMLMICDLSGPIAVGGVMGGAESEISDTTTNLLVESAYFDPFSVRQTSKLLGLSTDASFRFERGADPEMPAKALNLVSQMLEEICGGRCTSPVVDENPTPFQPAALEVRKKRVDQVLGIEIATTDIRDVLWNLEFQPEELSDDSIRVQVPSFRRDIQWEDDLVEEVARHYGYERIPSRFPMPVGAGRHAEVEGHDRIIEDTLVSFGFYQAINYAFTSPEQERDLLDDDPPRVALANPLTELDSHLRSSLLPGLVESLRRNLNLGSRDVRLFESGSVFFDRGERGVEELPCLALVVTGEFYRPFWIQTSESLGFFHLKGMMETLFTRLGLQSGFEAVSSISYLHPGVAAEIRLAGRKLGLMGELHPRLGERYKFPEKVFCAEIDLKPIYCKGLPEPEFTLPGRFPSVERDLSFLLDRTVTFSKILAVVQALEVAELIDFRLIDLYHGPNLPLDKLSLTVRLTFEHSARTLTQVEVGERCDSIVAALREQFAIEQR